MIPCFLWLCWQGKQRVVRRDSVVQVELAELSAELDLDILSRLGSLNRAFSHCSTQTPTSGLMQVILQSTFRSSEIIHRKKMFLINRKKTYVLNSCNYSHYYFYKIDSGGGVGKLV